MKKIISLFQRNYDGDRLVRDESVPGAEWVIAGEGVATQKYDGSCCMVRDGKLYKRYDAKKGRIPPDNFEAVQEPDPVTGHCPGWVPVGETTEDKYHREAWKGWTADLGVTSLPDGTYELLGPKVQGNPEKMPSHTLVAHRNADRLRDAPRNFIGIRDYLRTRDIEGIVWHHPDGRMVKIKKKDFGLPRKPAQPT